PLTLKELKALLNDEDYKNISSFGFDEEKEIVGDNTPVAFINKTGELVFQTKFIEAGDFNNSLAPILIDKKWGFIDNTGNIVIEPQYEYATNFSDGLACVRKDGKFGYIDVKGTF